LQVNKAVLKNGSEKIKLNVDITNNGPVSGKEVILLFFESKKSKTPRPKRELIAFKKVFINNNDTVTVEFNVSLKNLSYYHPRRKEFVTDDGVYNLQIMKNANDILLEHPIEVATGKPYIESVWNKLDSYQIKGGLRFDESDFERMVNVKLGREHIIHKRPYDLNNNIEDIEHTWLGGILKKNIDKQIKKRLANQPESFKLMVLKSLYQMPLRFLPKSTNGLIRMNLLEGLFELINHRFLRAIKVIFRKD